MYLIYFTEDGAVMFWTGGFIFSGTREAASKVTASAAIAQLNALQTADAAGRVFRIAPAAANLFEQLTPENLGCVASLVGASVGSASFKRYLESTPVIDGEDFSVSSAALEYLNTVRNSIRKQNSAARG